MEFEFILQEATSNYALKMFGNAHCYRWESGGAFGSDWSEKKWYVGILIIQNRLTKSENIFFFKTREVRDQDLYLFDLGHIIPIQEFGKGNFTIDNFCKQIFNRATHSEKSPFCSIDITSDFMDNINQEIVMEDADTRIKKDEDGWG